MILSALKRSQPVATAPVGFDVSRTLDKLDDLVADASRRGAKLAVFPEAFVSAYPKGLDFGARVGMRSPEGRDMFRRYFDSAIDVPGPATDRIGEAAKASGLHLVVGVIERDGGTLYCTALYFGPELTFHTAYRRDRPNAPVVTFWGQVVVEGDLFSQRGPGCWPKDEVQSLEELGSFSFTHFTAEEDTLFLFGGSRTYTFVRSR